MRFRVFVKKGSWGGGRWGEWEEIEWELGQVCKMRKDCFLKIKLNKKERKSHRHTMFEM